MKKNILILTTLLLSANAWAQGELDAFRMSSTDLQGTARGQAMGGAFGALGGDATSVAINPAGLGVYNSSEISGSLAFSSVGIETPSLKNSKSKVYFDNINYVGNYLLNDEQKLNFGFSFNRLKNFDRRYSGRGNWQAHSLTDFVANSSTRKGIPAGGANYNDDPWLSALFWDAYLINDISSNEYEGMLDTANGEKAQSHADVSEKGYVESYNFSLGTNVSNKLYLGLTFSITNMFYWLKSTYREDFEQGSGFYLDNYFETQGTGLQVNVGAIYRPTDWLRLGIAYHSPTVYTMTDYYQGYALANWNPRDEEKQTPNGHTDYNFHTPQSWVFSVAGVLGSQAVLSLDYEIKDFGQTRLYYSDGIAKEEANRDIQEAAKLTSTLRAGLEYRFTPQFSGRLGFSYAQNPYKDAFREGKLNYSDGALAPAIFGTVPHYTLEGDATYLTAGIGYKFSPSTYLDAAFIYKTQKENLFYYPGTDPVALKNNTMKAVITLGYKY
ncbi:hemin receptor [Bacteroidia bacterium]|nr:hemin receptor [Bacteroidia bacterium]